MTVTRLAAPSVLYRWMPYEQRGDGTRQVYYRGRTWEARPLDPHGALSGWVLDLYVATEGGGFWQPHRPQMSWADVCSYITGYTGPKL